MARVSLKAFVTTPARSAVLLLMCCMVMFWLMGIGTTTVAAETFQLDLGKEGKHNSTHTLSPGSNDTYHISAGSPGGLGCVVNLTGDGTFNVSFLKGYTESTSGSLEEYSSAKYPKKAYTKSYYVENDEDEKVTFIINNTEKNFTVTYNIWLASWSLSRDPSKVNAWILVGMGVVGVIVVVGVVWVYMSFPKYRKSFRSVRFSPLDLMQFFRGTQQKYESPIRAQGSFVSKQKYAIHRGDGTALCPFCRKTLGEEEEGYLFQVVNFIDERPMPDQSGRMVKRVWRAVAVYCPNCGMIVGVTR